MISNCAIIVIDPGAVAWALGGLAAVVLGQWLLAVWRR